MKSGLRTAVRALRGVCAAAVLAAGAAYAGSDETDAYLDATNIQTSGEIAVGRLYGYRTATEGPGDAAFSNALRRAQADGIPILSVWSASGCSYCNAFTRMLNTSEAQDWIASQRIYFAFFKEGGAAAAQAYRYAYEIGPKEGYRTWPAARLAWTPASGEGADEAWGFGDVGTSFRAFTNKVLTVLAAYRPAGASASFLCGDPDEAPAARLEATAATALVYVPLSIPANVTNALVATFPDGSLTEVALEPSDADREEWVAVPVAEKFAAAGERAELALVESATGATRARSAITFVGDAVAGTAHDPFWVGERTAETLAAGEWTVDVDAATARAARRPGAAYTLVNVGGELWCPDCIGVRTNLLETAAFASWARANDVSLALVDVPRDGDAPTLFSHAAYKGVSGSPYLSRHGIGRADAAAALAQAHERAYETFNPAHEGRTRAWLPTFFLLRKDGTVAAKFCGDRNYPNGTSFTVDDCLRRFDEMIRLSDDADEWENNDWSTTTAEVAIGGAAASGTLSAVDGNTGSGTGNRVIDAFRLTGDVPAGATPYVAVRSADGMDAGVRLSVGTAAPGDAALAVARTAAAEGRLADGVTVIAGDGTPASDAAFYAVLEGDDAAVFTYSNKTSSVRAYTLSADWCLVPGGEEKTFAVPAAGDVKVSVRKGSFYAFGAGEPAAADFVRVEGLWRATRTGMGVVSFDAACAFAYRDARPETWNVAAVTGVASEGSVAVDDTYGKPLVGRVSGALPAGLTVAYSATDHSVKVTGVPSGAAGTYESTWCIAERGADGTRIWWTVTFTCTVTELDASFNPFGAAGTTLADCPVVARDAETGAVRAVVGLVTVSVGANGRMKATYANGKRSFAFPMLRGWTAADAETGELRARFARDGFALDLSVFPNGAVCAEVVDPDWAEAGTSLAIDWAAADWSAATPATAWQGTYTASLSPSNVTARASAGAGRGSLSLRLNAALDVRRGRVTFAGRSPAGDVISGAARLGLAFDDAGFVDDGVARLVLFCRLSGGRLLSGILEVDADAATRHADWPQSIRSAAGVPCVLLSGVGEAALDGAAEYEGLGGYYDPKESLLVPFAKYGEYQGLFGLVLVADEAAGLAPLGLTVTEKRIDRVLDAANPFDVTFSFTRSSGLYAGAFTTYEADGARRRARFFGALMPGWVDCRCGRDTREEPFGLGAAWAPAAAGRAARAFAADLVPCE